MLLYLTKARHSRIVKHILAVTIIKIVLRFLCYDHTSAVELLNPILSFSI